MRFDEVRVGDTVRVHAEFNDGTRIKSEFTVTYTDEYVFCNEHVGVNSDSRNRKSLSIERVARKPKVGDLMTGAQVQRLPNHAVFLDVWNKPRTVFDGKSYGPGLTVEAALDLHDLRDPVYRLIYLPGGGN